MKSLQLEQLPAFVHVGIDGTLLGSAEGWDPLEWRRRRRQPGPHHVVEGAGHPGAPAIRGRTRAPRRSSAAVGHSPHGGAQPSGTYRRMAKPQQAELRRSGKVPALDPDASVAKLSAQDAPDRVQGPTARSRRTSDRATTRTRSRTSRTSTSSPPAWASSPTRRCRPRRPTSRRTPRSPACSPRPSGRRRPRGLARKRRRPGPRSPHLLPHRPGPRGPGHRHPHRQEGARAASSACAADIAGRHPAGPPRPTEPGLPAPGLGRLSRSSRSDLRSGEPLCDARDVTEFEYTPLLPTSGDETTYRRLDIGGVEVVDLGGEQFLRVADRGAHRPRRRGDARHRPLPAPEPPAAAARTSSTTPRRRPTTGSWPPTC